METGGPGRANEQAGPGIEREQERGGGSEAEHDRAESGQA